MAEFFSLELLFKYSSYEKHKLKCWIKNAATEQAHYARQLVTNPSVCLSSACPACARCWTSTICL